MEEEGIYSVRWLPTMRRLKPLLVWKRPVAWCSEERLERNFSILPGIWERKVQWRRNREKVFWWSWRLFYGREPILTILTEIQWLCEMEEKTRERCGEEMRRRKSAVPGYSWPWEGWRRGYFSMEVPAWRYLRRLNGRAWEEEAVKCWSLPAWRPSLLFLEAGGYRAQAEALLVAVPVPEAEKCLGWEML